jgi:hypothetical protein
MLRKAVLFVCILALGFGSSARADPILTDYVTSNATLNLPTLAGVPGVIHVDGGNNSGVAYANAFTSLTGGSLRVGTPVVSVGSIPLVQYTVGPPPGSTSNFNLANHNLVATYALSGSTTALANGMSVMSQFTTGTLRVYDTGTTAFSANNPNTWTSGTLLASYKLAFQDTMVHNSVVPGPTTGALFGSQIAQPGANQDTAALNLLSPFNSDKNLLFDRVSGNLLATNTPPNPLADGVFVISSETLLNTTMGGDNGLGASGIAALNAIANTFIGTPFTTAADAFSPNPVASFNGDTSQSVGLTLFPVFQPSIVGPGGIPEPASLLLWGALTAGIGVWGGVRRFRKE